MKSIAEKMLQVRERLRSAADAVSLKIVTALAKLRHNAKDEIAASQPAPAKPGRWWHFRVRPQSATTATAVETAARLAAASHSRILFGRALRYLALAVLAFVVLPYILIPLYAIVNPPLSALMVRQSISGTHVRQKWVDFDDISPNLVKAVLLAEDASYCRHSGVDWNAIGEALESAEDGETPRGASTVTMQTAKNLFLWNNQDYLRKGLELPLAYYMTLVLSKRRVAEIYLNIAEWGPGIFGAEAAARYHFGKSAAALTPTEASLLAASLPSPIKRRAGRPSAKLARIADHIDERTDRESRDVACVFD